MILLRLLLIFCVLTQALSCKKKDEVYTFDANAALNFSADSVWFDTVFSGLLTPTQRLQVFNRNSNAVSISSIKLIGGSSSPFTVIINGVQADQVDNIPLRGNDSLYILASANFPTLNNAQPYLLEDTLEFMVNGNRQWVRLVAYAQDVHMINGGSLCNQTWVSGKPYLIYNAVTVPVGCALDLDPGVRVYCHEGSELRVQGTLRVNGSATQPVLITHDKLDYRNKNLPGQWNGICIESGSKNNRISFASVLSGSNGIVMKAEVDADTIPELVLDHVNLQNCTFAGFEATQTDALLYNVGIVNCGEGLVKVNGGNVHGWHLTLADYSYDLVRLDRALVLRNSTDLSFSLHNSIVYGDRTEALNYEQVGTAQFLVRIDSCIVRTAKTIGGSNNFNVNPEFEAAFKRDFHLKATSPAINTGSSSFVKDDLEGKLRDASPDRGAFEY